MNTSPSLRERQKAETWKALHEAAATLVLERGLESSTVDAIAARAGVSPRTFFNYFPVKEDAILGMRSAVLDPVLLEGFSLERDLLGQVSRLLLAVASSVLEGVDQARRRELMRQYPSLSHRLLERTREAEDVVREALAGLLLEDPQWSSGIGEHDARDVSRIIVMMAGIPLRFTVDSAAYSPTTGLTAEDLTPALNLFHHLQRKLS